MRVDSPLARLIVIILLGQNVFAQLFTISPYQNPPSLHFQVITTEHFEIVFPDEIEKDAQRVANILEFVYLPNSKTLGQKPSRITVILQNQNTVSNAFVQLAPRKSEWYNTPPQAEFSGTADWYTLLGTHEFRHVVQLDKFHKRFVMLIYTILGESGESVVTFFTTPPWFWEGDAVGQETALTQSGRGRLPSFTLPLRAAIVSGENRDYYNWLLGSYKRYPMDPYPLGYLMTTYVKRENGAEAWSRIIDRYTSFPFAYAFTRAMKSTTGKGEVSTFEAMRMEMSGRWKKQADSIVETPATHLSHHDGYLNLDAGMPQKNLDGSIVFFEFAGSGRPGYYRLLSNGKKEFLVRPVGDPYFSVAQDQLLWIDAELDIRWGIKSGGAIKKMNLETREIQTLTRDRRFVYAALSPDGQKIAAVEFDQNNQCYLRILNSLGEEVSHTRSDDYLIQPTWSDDNLSLIMVRINLIHGQSLSVYDVKNQVFEDLLPYSHAETIRYPRSWKNYVFFNASYSGIDNVYAIEFQTKQILQVTSRKLGGFNAFPADSEIYFDDYSSDGYVVAKMKIDTNLWKPVDPTAGFVKDNYVDPLVTQENGPLNFDSVPKIKYPVKNYSPLANLVNIHDWYPFSDGRGIGLSILSTNKLNTAQISATGLYDQKRGTQGIGVVGEYAGLFPIMKLGGYYGARTSTYSDSNRIKNYGWTEKSIEYGFRIPLNLTKDSYRTTIEFGLSGRVAHVSNQDAIFSKEANNGKFFPVQYSLRAARSTSAYGYIYPYLGQSLSVSYSHTPLGGDYIGKQIAIEGNTFFPGFFRRQNLWFQGNFERQPKGSNYRFVNTLLFPRGYKWVYNDRLWKVSANYTIPFWYPDVNLLFMYFKRFYAVPFCDYGIGTYSGRRTFEQNYRSWGNELICNLHLFNMPIEIGLGLRQSYRLDKRNWKHEPIILIATDI